MLKMRKDLGEKCEFESINKRSKKKNLIEYFRRIDVNDVLNDVSF